MESVTRPWTNEELNNVTKKELVEFLQKNGNNSFLQRHKLKGKVVSIAKCTKKDLLDNAYNDLFESQDFRTEADEKELEQLEQQRKEEQEAKKKQAEANVSSSSSSSSSPLEEKKEKKGYTKRVLVAGNKSTYPKKGDTVKVRYKGMLDDGTVFDSNMGETGRRKPNILQFVVGKGKVIKGWDEALMEMSLKEKASIVIEPSWAYGAKGVEGKIPPNSRLTFEVILEDIM